VISSGRRERATLRVAGILSLTAIAAFAQAPDKFVTIDISALGPHAQAVTDLKSSDIHLFDNNNPQSILYWRFNQRRAGTPHVTAVVFNLQSAGIKGPEWIETLNALRQFESSEFLYFYVVTAGGVLLPLHELPRPDAESRPVNTPWIAQNVPAFEQMWQHQQARQSTRSSPIPPVADFSLYRDLAARLAAFPERKNLVCINCMFAKSAHFDSNNDAAWSTRAADLRQLAGALNYARVAVYLVGGKPSSTQVEDNRGPLPLDQVGAFAEATGGRVYGGGQIRQAIADAIADGRSTYRLAYLPGADNWDGKRHKIRVVSARRDVHIQARRWYGAGLLEDIAREWTPAIPETAISSPFDQTDLDISVSAEKTGTDVVLRVHVDAGGVLFVPRAGRYSGSLTMQALCYTPEGRRLACTEPARVKLDLSEQEHAVALRDGLGFPLRIPLREASSKIRVVVHDESSGASGSSTLLTDGVR
jgi:VWFA-related protein